MMERLAYAQADWHGWTLRNVGRLAEARRIVAEHRLPGAGGPALGCSPLPPAPPPSNEIINAVEMAPMNQTIPENVVVAPPTAPPLTENEVR